MSSLDFLHFLLTCFIIYHLYSWIRINILRISSHTTHEINPTTSCHHVFYFRILFCFAILSSVLFYSCTLYHHFFFCGGEGVMVHIMRIHCTMHFHQVMSWSSHIPSSFSFSFLFSFFFFQLQSSSLS